MEICDFVLATGVRMRVVLLAAGASKRLRPLTNSKPKCLLPLIGDRTILDGIIENLLWAGLEKFVIVTGFESDQLHAHVNRRFPQLNVTWVHNREYATTNNSYSLWLAKDFLSEPFMLLDSDIVFDRRIVYQVLKDKHKDVLAVRTEGRCGDEEMKVELDAAGWVRRISKDMEPHMATGESIGIEKFSGSFQPALFDELDRRIRQVFGANEFYEAAFQAVVHHAVPLFGLTISPYPCLEIDTPEDYKHACEMIKYIPSLSDS